MYITNLTSSVFILAGGFRLRGLGSVEIPNGVYSGNSSLKNQVDTLLANGMINAYDKPEDAEVDLGLPDSYEAGDQEFSLAVDGGVASLSVDTDMGGENYGSVELFSAGGGEASLKSYSNDSDEALLHINKTLAEEGPLLSLEIDGIHAMRISSTGGLGFDGKEPSIPVVNAGTASAEDIANALIDLGLFRSA